MRFDRIIAPLIGLLLYWRTPWLWFVTDDFARLALPMVARENGIMHALFTPIAQGTVRVLGERAFFLIFSELFGLHALPFLPWMLATWVATILLVQVIGARLTGSNFAGAAAAVIWAASSNSTWSVIWPAAYYQVAGAFCLLAALYSRLRWIDSDQTRWRVAEWVAYLASLGSIETAVMYPLICVLHALCFDRKRLRSTTLLFIPAAAYAAMHFLFIPKAADSTYAIVLDERIFVTLARYLKWTLEPGSAALRAHAEMLRMPELAVGLVIGIALVAFGVRRAMRHEYACIFFVGFFVFLLGPFLLLPAQVMPMYLTIGSIGLAWLAGWGIASAWKSGSWLRLGVIGLTTVYLVVSAAAINAETRWFEIRGQRMRVVLEAVAAALAAHPGNAIALKGVSAELFNDGFTSYPFRLVGAKEVWLTPGAGFPITAEFKVSPEQLRTAVAQWRARILEVDGDSVRDITPVGNL